MTSDDSGRANWVDFLKLAGTFLLLSVAWGLFYSLLSPIITTFQWLSTIFSWSETDLGWIGLLLKNLRFGWTAALLMAAVITSYSLLGALVFIAFIVTRRFNERRLAYFANQHPLVYAELEETVGSISTHVGVWWLCSVGVWLSAFVAHYFGVRSATWVVTGSVTAVLGVFYIVMLFNAKNLGRWAFQHVRGFILPYVFVATPIFVAFSFATLLQNDIVTEFFTYFGTAFESTLSTWTFEFEWSPIDVLRALATSLG